MNDDFNTPILIAHLFEAVRQINLVKDGKAKITVTDQLELQNSMNAFVFEVLGITAPEGNDTTSETLDEVLHLLIDLRNKARANKDFATSDNIRDKLEAMGIQLKDGKEGTTFSIN